MTDRTRPCRRAFLGAIGTTALAGCSTIEGLFSEEPTYLDADELAAIVADDRPIVPETLPIRIRESHLEDSEGRAHELLESVPDPLGAEEIPNGAIRRDLQHVRDRAERELDEAAAAESGYETMTELRSARRYAANVAAVWQWIDEGEGGVDVEARAEEIDEALTTFQGEWEYVGDDAVAALLVHEELERMNGAAERYVQSSLDDAEEELDSAPAVGKVVESIEYARATVEDASHVFEQHESTLDSPRPVHEELEIAGSSLAEEVETHLEPLPDIRPGDESKLVNRDVEGEPAGYLLRGFIREIYWGSERLREGSSAGPANDVRRAHTTLAYLEALEPIRERIDDGERFEVESVEDVREWRERATEAVTALADGEVTASLNRASASDLALGISNVDRDIEYLGDPTRASYVSRSTVDYLRIAEVADATPAASRTVVGALRDAKMDG